ncbi:MAG: hypothetical protein V3V08_04315 [Nannocystaceae bacterium]
MGKPTIRRRVVADGSGTRRRIEAVTRSDSDTALLHDVPIELRRSRDGKRLFVILPYELWVLDSRSLNMQRRIELSMPRPSLSEDAEGVLWIGGQHLYRGGVWTDAVVKVGSKLGGFVDQVVLLRPGLLCGVGRHGEVLWDTNANELLHRRKTREHHVYGLLATADERALWAGGESSSWLIHPARTSGYTRVRFPTTSSDAVEAEVVVALGMTTHGRCILGARDGGIAWTHSDLRLAHERFPTGAGEHAWAVAVAGDERWIYVLRPKGLLQRFRIDEPKKPKKRADREVYRRGGTSRALPEQEAPVPDPPAQCCRLELPASCLTLSTDVSNATRLILGGPRSGGHLGRLWYCDPSTLEWQDQSLGTRELVPRSTPTAPEVPSFVATRNKLEGPLIRELKVDQVLSGSVQLYATRDHGHALEQRAVRLEATKVLSADALLLPAMLRLCSGVARPGLLLWSSVRAPTGDPVPLRWFTWGDRPQGWLLLDTPSIREQAWTRGEVFPLTTALAHAPPRVPGMRPAIPEKWVDAALFAAMARECKKQLEVLW